MMLLHVIEHSQRKCQHSSYDSNNWVIIRNSINLNNIHMLACTFNKFFVFIWSGIIIELLKV